ncbi:hypothetical protein ABR738_00685 [Streptomyces sp. Edi4]|uniref:hypothetical protein n=1 Tax=Streptomyces sp. Edi4 TaxID=3162527 RepID=UPI0033063157
MGTAVLERTQDPDVSAAPRLAKAPHPAPEAQPFGHDQALDAMLYAARRMGIVATDRQIATLLGVAERHLLVPGSDGSSFPHGTMRGYRRHRRRKEAACEDCRRACRLAAAERRKRNRVERQMKPCGTEAAYHRHLRAWEDPCDSCRTAHRAYVQEYRERRQRAIA